MFTRFGLTRNSDLIIITNGTVPSPVNSLNNKSPYPSRTMLNSTQAGVFLGMLTVTYRDNWREAWASHGFYYLAHTSPSVCQSLSDMGNYQWHCEAEIPCLSSPTISILDTQSLSFTFFPPPSLLMMMLYNYIDTGALGKQLEGHRQNTQIWLTRCWA